MPGSRITHRISEIILLIIIAGCAKVSSPSGGPKDRVPPVVVKSNPAKGTKNFKGNQVSVTFDEYVVLDKINDKFMVSPPMKKRPKVYLRGKSVVVQYEESLLDSTTYTFNFQDAIRDLNENNVLNNYQFVFSTGPVIDSLSVTGNVYNALSLDAPDETLVLLYKELYDSAVVKHIPTYISRIDKSGYFRIDNVKAGKYRLYALKDADNSKTFNLPDEQFAFLTDTIDVSSPKDYLPVIKDTVKTTGALTAKADTIVLHGEYKLILFQTLKNAHYLTSSSRNLPYKLSYTLSLPPDSGSFTFDFPKAHPGSYFIERNKANDSILVWLTDSTLYSQSMDTTIVNYPFTDTTGKVIQKQDTIIMRFSTPRPTRQKMKKTPFGMTSALFNGALRPGQQIILQAPSPFGIPDTSKIRLYEESGTTKGKEEAGTPKVKIPFTFAQDTANSCKMIMKTRLVQGKNYMFIADSGAFRNIYGDVSDSLGYRVTIKKDEAYGFLTLNISNYEGPRIIQLLTKEERIVREIKMAKDGKAEFPYLDPGKYRLRVIYDLNGDGKWTTGDFKKGLQPEPASYYFQEINMKENWYDTQTWDIGEQNIKKLKNSASVTRSGQ
jgi:uncharacterized protein (DUF2141 family)